MVPSVPAGLSCTRRNPSVVKLPVTTVVLPAVMLTAWGAGASKPGTSENDTGEEPGASFTQLRPHWSMGMGVVDPAGVTEMREGTAGLVVTRSRPGGAAVEAQRAKALVVV